MFKRLSLSTIKANENQDNERLLKGFMTELSTPINSVPYTNYGSEIFQTVDKPMNIASTLNRVEIVRLAKKSSYADKLEVDTIGLTELDETGRIKQNIVLKILNNNEHLTADLFL